MSDRRPIADSVIRSIRPRSPRPAWELLMAEVIGISFPLFALIGLGYLAHRFGAVKDDAAPVLITFVYYFLLPPFFIMKIVDADVSQGLDARVLLAYYLA